MIKSFSAFLCYPCSYVEDKCSSKQKNFVQDEIVSEPCKQKNLSEQGNLKQSFKIDVLIDEIKSEPVESKKLRRVCDNPVLPDETGFSVCEHGHSMQRSMGDLWCDNVFSDVKSDVIHGPYSVLSQSFVKTVNEVMSICKGDVEGPCDVQNCED